MLNRKRFNVIACGRRFGKTALAERLLTFEENGSNGALFDFPVAYITPTFRMLEEVYRNIVYDFNELIVRKHDNKRIQFSETGVIDFWSFENFDSIRGRKYKRVVIDEAAIVPSHYLKEGWEQSIRALLTDYRGDAYLLSTPKGKKHYFKELADNHSKLPSWAFFQMPTTANPHIDPQEVEEARLLLPPVVFAQEYLAEFTDMKSDKLFIHSFDLVRHCPNPPKQYNPSLPIVLSVDFNVSPMSALICQHDIHFRQIAIIDEFRLLNSDVYQLCDKVKEKYDTRRILVTGDAAGWNRSAGNRGHKSMFDIIQAELKLNWSQIKTPRGKPAGYVQEKRNLATALFSRHPDFTINNAPFLVDDLLNVEVTSDGKMDKNVDSTKSHLLDCLCDYLYSMCRDAVKTPSIFKAK